MSSPNTICGGWPIRTKARTQKIGRNLRPGRAVSHKLFRLMLLSSEPDMIHGGLLHRAKPQISADGLIIPHFPFCCKSNVQGTHGELFRAFSGHARGTFFAKKVPLDPSKKLSVGISFRSILRLGLPGMSTAHPSAKAWLWRTHCINAPRGALGHAREAFLQESIPRPFKKLSVGISFRSIQSCVPDCLE